MVSITYVSADGQRTVCDVPTGTSLMQAAVKGGVDGILAECGGQMICGTCHVFVDPDRLDDLPPVSLDEDATLDFTAEPRRPTSRLSCQLPASSRMDGLVVEVAPVQL